MKVKNIKNNKIYQNVQVIQTEFGKRYFIYYKEKDRIKFLGSDKNIIVLEDQ